MSEMLKLHLSSAKMCSLFTLLIPGGKYLLVQSSGIEKEKSMKSVIHIDMLFYDKTE